METPDYDHILDIRNVKNSDYADVKAIMEQAYRGMGGAWTRDEFKTLLTLFSEGQICIEDKGRLVACAWR